MPELWCHISEYNTEDKCKNCQSLEIIKKTERKLLNECIRSINNTIELYMYKRDSLVLQLEEKLDNNNNNNQEIIEDVIILSKE